VSLLQRRLHQVGELFTISLTIILNLRFFRIRKYSIFLLSRYSLSKIHSQPRSLVASSSSYFLSLNPLSCLYIISLSSISNLLAKLFRFKLPNTYIFLQEPYDYISLHLLKNRTHRSYTILSHCTESALVSNYTNATLSYTWLEHHLTSSAFLKSEYFYNHSSSRSDSVVYIGSDICDISSHRQRLNFLSQLDQSSFPLATYGRSVTGIFRTFSNYKGLVDNKEAVLLDSMYSLVIENAFEPYYISEKLTDALLCGCKVIYYGSPSFIRLTGPIPIFPLKSLDLASFTQAFTAASLFPQNTYNAILRSNLYRIHNSFSYSLNPSGFIIDVFNSLGQT